MSKIELLLRSPLIKDALFVLLTEAGFSVLRESVSPDHDTTMIIDFDDCRHPERIYAHQRCGAKIVVLASEADSQTMSDDQIAPLSGALTYSLSADAVVRALRLICSGERVFPHNLGLDRNRPAGPIDIEPRYGGDHLSAREREVLLQVVEGHSNKVIAWHLRIAEATVKVHLTNLLRKARVTNRTQAAIWALANLPELVATPCDLV